MDPGIAWFQEEQDGPSKVLWLSIWETIQEMELEQQMHNPSPLQQIPTVINTNNTNNFIVDNNQKLKGMTNKEVTNTSNVLIENNGQPPIQQTTASVNQQSTNPPQSSQQQHQQQHIERSYYNPSRKKTALYENRASTYNMNRYQNRIIGKHKGCPWRPVGCQYPAGVLGYAYIYIHIENLQYTNIYNNRKTHFVLAFSYRIKRNENSQRYKQSESTSKNNIFSNKCRCEHFRLLLFK